MNNNQDNATPVGVRAVNAAVGGTFIAGCFSVVVILGLFRAAGRSIVAYLLAFASVAILHYVFGVWKTSDAALSAALYFLLAWVVGELIHIGWIVKRAFVDGIDPYAKDGNSAHGGA